MARNLLWQKTAKGRLVTEVVDDVLRVTCYEEEDPSATPPTRVIDGLQVLYTFEKGSGTTVHDVSAKGAPLNMTVASGEAVRWMSKGGLSVESPTVIASAAPATKVIDAAMASNEITIEAWVKAAEAIQEGPARIVTLSTDSHRPNFTVARSGQLYDVQLRTTETTDNGTPSLSTAFGSLESELTHVVYTRGVSGLARIYINGEDVGFRQTGGDLSNWDRECRLALADKLAGRRAWLGEYHLVAVYDRILSADEVHQNFEAGARNVPEQSLSLGAGKTFYVATSGDDSSPGTEAEPFRTIQHGIDVMGAGDTLYIKEGTYTEGVHNIPSGTSWSSPTTITAYPGDTVTINGEYSCADR
jgi:hypothetical protein